MNIESIERFLVGAYQNFLMRDILSIILPGLLSIISFLSLFKVGNLYQLIQFSSDASFFHSKSSALVIILLSYPVGWALFYLGVSSGLIKLCKRNGHLWFLFFSKSPSAAWKKDLSAYFSEEREFKGGIEKSEDKKRDLLYRERIVVIRQMTGTFLVSVVISATLIVLNISFEGQFKELLAIGYIILICAGLYLTHHRLIEQQKIWQESRNITK